VRRRFSRHDSRIERDWCLSRDAGGLRKPEQTQSSSAEVPLDKGDLGHQRLPAKTVRQWCRRSSADFGSPRTIFHQIMGHCSHALKNLNPGVGARFGRMNRKIAHFRPHNLFLPPRTGSEPDGARWSGTIKKEAWVVAEAVNTFDVGRYRPKLLTSFPTRKRSCPRPLSSKQLIETLPNDTLNGRLENPPSTFACPDHSSGTSAARGLRERFRHRRVGPLRD